MLVDIKASRLPALAAEGEASFKRALLMYAVCLAVGVVLLILGTLCNFLVLMNAAYKVPALNYTGKNHQLACCNLDKKRLQQFCAASIAYSC